MDKKKYISSALAGDTQGIMESAEGGSMAAIRTELIETMCNKLKVNLEGNPLDSLHEVADGLNAELPIGDTDCKIAKLFVLCFPSVVADWSGSSGGIN